MKSYFKFNLNGKKVFPIWILLIVVFIIPYTFVQLRIQGLQNAVIEDPEIAANNSAQLLLLNCLILFLLFIEYSLMFFVVKLTIEGIEFKEKALIFAGKFGKYILLMLGGFALCVITLGIYTPWFHAKINKYVAKNTSLDSESFEFKGKGTDLFMILLTTIIIPMIIVFAFEIFVAFSTGLASNLIPGQLPNISVTMALSLCFSLFIIFIMFFPFTYYFYKWMVNYKYKNFEIKMEATFWRSVSKIFLEVVLSMITFGIYTPLATLKLYKYFSEKTIAVSNETTKKFGFDLEIVDDFLIIWGQILLCIVTLGFYYPWAYCKISSRFINKTFIVETEA